MRNNERLLLLSALLLLIPHLPAVASDQDDYSYSRYVYRTEAFAIVGTGSWYNNSSGLVLGGGVIFRPYPKAGFEISYRHLATQHSYGQNDFYEESGQAFTASVHYYFSELRAQPYLLLGGGYADTKSHSSYEYEGIVYRDTYSDSSFVLEAGGGVNIFIAQKFSVRPDVRLQIGDPGALHGGLNLCYHW